MTHQPSVIRDAEIANKAQNLALLALALSVIGLAGAFFVHALIGTLAAGGVLLALTAMRRMRESNLGGGRGIAITAIVLGIIGTIVAFLTLLGVWMASM